MCRVWRGINPERVKKISRHKDGKEESVQCGTRQIWLGVNLVIGPCWHESTTVLIKKMAMLFGCVNATVEQFEM